MADNSPHERFDKDESSDAELELEDLELGLLVKQDKYAKVYSVVTSEWASIQWEAHVFEPQNNKQARFLERMVWPKMRKSNNYKTDFARASARIFVHRVTDGTASFNIAHTNTTQEKAEPFDMGAAISSSGPKGGNPLQPVTFVMLVFVCYCLRVKNSCLRMNKPIPDFVGRQSSTRLQNITSDTARDSLDKMWEHLKRDAQSFTDDTEGNGTNTAKDVDEEAPPTSTRGSEKPGRGSARPLPLDRDLEMILDFARMLSEDTPNVSPEVYSPPGLKFFSEHLVPQLSPAEDSGLEALASKQQDWTDRLSRLIERIPKILKKLTQQRAAIWRASVARVVQVFGNIDEDSSKDSDTNRRWPNILRWMIEYSFDGFDTKAVQAVAEGLSAGLTPTTSAWFLRVRSHALMYQWAKVETTKSDNGHDTPDAMLMKMLQAHTKRELVVGMVPILQRMRWVSELKAKYWKGNVACNEFKTMVSQDSAIDHVKLEDPFGCFLAGNYSNLSHSHLDDPYEYFSGHKAAWDIIVGSASEADSLDKSSTVEMPSWRAEQLAHVAVRQLGWESEEVYRYFYGVV
ncbi:tannase and feruloyl esterase [Apiospora arundinis]